ncbi:hypothetical protein [Aquimarina agarivorans]|uniref:hypothetical protein n=1 Tax=Aquimarina agarivorans TaxID=980584 RepID=UPI000248E7A3|nr:hypothetical protein [Aquimarina agarivorans]
MNKTFIVVLALFLHFTSVNAQRFKEVLKWQVETISGGLVFGISENKEKANQLLNDFQNRNLETKYDISGEKRIFTYATLPIENKHDNPIELFKDITKKGYKVISAEDIKALSIIEKKNFKAGVDYYINARNADKDYTIARFNDLQLNYSKYFK